MDSESKLVVELWEYFRDMLVASKRQDAALHILRLFEEYGMELDLEDIRGECDILDEAIDLSKDEEDQDLEELDYDY